MEAIDVDTDHGMSAVGGRGAFVRRGNVLLQPQPRVEACRQIEVGLEQGDEMEGEVPGEG